MMLTMMVTTMAVAAVDKAFVVVAVAAALAAWLYVYGWTTRVVWSLRDGLPPGPRPLPILGNLAELAGRGRGHGRGTFLHRSLARLSSRYGPLVYLRLGSVHTAVVSSPELAMQCLCGPLDETFASRPSVCIFRHLFYGQDVSIGFGKYGPKWRDLRKLCILHALRPHKVHESEAVIVEEVERCMEAVGRAAGSGAAVDVTDLVKVAVEDAICRLMVGRRASELVSRRRLLVGDAEKKKKSLRDLMRACPAVISRRMVSTWAPCLGFLDSATKREMDEMHRAFDVLLDEIVDERQCAHDDDDPARQSDFLDAMLAADSMTRTDIKNLLLETVTLALDSTWTTVEWAMAELVGRPAKLRKLREELDACPSAWSPSPSPSGQRRPSLPYLRAVVNETLRLHAPLPTLIPHASTRACWLGAFSIPDGTCLFVNVWAVMRDPRVWDRPHDFVPERFVGRPGWDELLAGHGLAFAPFGAGRRGCPGFRLAYSIIELLLASLLLRFDWRLRDGDAAVDVSAEKHVIAVSRKEPLILIPVPRQP